MASSALHHGRRTFWSSMSAFLWEELKPFPGRWSLVARMVIAAVLCMIVVVTFRMPYGAAGVVCAFVLSRENLLSTAKSGFYFLVAFVAWVILLPVGARMFASIPITHFVWEGQTAFLCFFFLKTFTYFPLATGLVVVATSTMTIWYLPGPAEQNIELTLWQVPSTAAGVLITLLVEAVFRHFRREGLLVTSIADRIQAIEAMLGCYADSLRCSAAQVQSMTQYAVDGTGMLRQQVARERAGKLRPPAMLALVELVGHSIDISAGLLSENQDVNTVSCGHAQVLKVRLTQIREDIQLGRNGVAPQPSESNEHGSSLFVVLEQSVEMLEQFLLVRGCTDLPPALFEEAVPTTRVIVEDAFSNAEYTRFALAGAATSMLCYMIYVGLNWPGISTAVTTCALTALGDIGSSRQKQLLRLGGATIGALVFGLGSQIFILPYIDSIVGLIILFAFVTGASAYVATSSPRLSYAGLQMAFAFYLINFSDFTVPLDLTIGRDRAVGVLLGVGAMWLVFERLYPRPAPIHMVRTFAQLTRMIASLEALAISAPGGTRVRALRDQIKIAFVALDAEAEAALFERGEHRSANLAAHDRIKRWSAALRTLYLLELPWLSFSPLEQSAQPSNAVVQASPEPLAQVSGTLIHVAELLEAQLTKQPYALQSYNKQEHEFTGDSARGDASESAGEGSPGPSLKILLTLVRDLERDVQRQPVFLP